MKGSCRQPGDNLSGLAYANFGMPVAALFCSYSSESPLRLSWVRDLCWCRPLRASPTAPGCFRASVGGVTKTRGLRHLNLGLKQSGHDLTRAAMPSRIVEKIANKLAFFPPTPATYEVAHHKDGAQELYIQALTPPFVYVHSYPRLSCAYCYSHVGHDFRKATQLSNPCVSSSCC